MAFSKRKLFLDMDGVLCDFTTPANKILKRKIGFDITKKEWKRIESVSGFWGKLKPLPGYLKLWELSKLFETYILTAPGGSTDDKKFWCADQKCTWCFEYLPEFNFDQFVHCQSSEKCKYADVSNILIDDYIENIKQWRDASGIAIHHTNVDLSIESAKQWL